MDEQVTRDTLLRGRVTLFQPARGFRSSLDPVLLAGSLTPPFGRFLEIGTGTGALSFLLLARDASASGVGLEIQSLLAGLCERAVGVNGFGDRFSLRCEDARRAAIEPGSFDLVVSNPPFRALGQGPLPPDPGKAQAHHEISLTLADWTALAARALRPGGTLAVVFPWTRVNELISQVRREGFGDLRVRPVLPRMDETPSRALVFATFGPGDLVTTDPPLLLHGPGDERYSPEVCAMLGEGSDP